MQKTSIDKLTELLQEDSDLLENQLKLAGLQVMLFEFLRQIVHERLEFFFGDMTSTAKGGWTWKVPEKHQDLFSNKNGPAFEKQLTWFEEMGAISHDDIEIIQLQRQRRNDIGHRMINVLTDDSISSIANEECQALLGMIFKIDNWWLREVEMSIDPDFPGREDEDARATATSFATQILIQFVRKACGLPADEPSE